MANEPQLPAPRPHGRATRVFLAATASLAILVGVVAGAGYASYLAAQRRLSDIREVPLPGDTSNTPQDFGPCAQEACNYLILGSDSRSGLSPQQQQQTGTNANIGGEARADTIILVHTEPHQDKAVILSFPRDLWVNITGRGYGKINSAFEGGLKGGGPQRMARTIEHLSGLDVSHVLYVDLNRFQEIVDTLGGVRMCVPYAMHDDMSGLDIRAGCQTFDGWKALAFVRSRHQACDTIPDFARITRQQQFLRAVMNRLLSPSELAKAPTLIRSVAAHLVRDRSLSLGDIIYLVRQLNGINTGEADFRVVPGTPKTIFTAQYPPPTGISIVQMSPRAEQIFKAIREGKPLGNLGKELQQTPISPATVEVAVFDQVSGGSAQLVETMLSEAGFDISPGITTDAAGLSGLVSGPAIAYRPGEAKMAHVVQAYLYPSLQLVRVPKTALASPVGVVVTAAYSPSQPPSSTQPSC